MAERQWRGEWWVAGEQEYSCPGTLHYAEDGRLRLELIGGFDITIREPLPEGNGYSIKYETREVSIIHGLCSNEEFTLLDNNATHTSGFGMFRGSIAKQDWTSIRALRGVHVQDLSEPIFNRAHLQLERLLHWSARSTFELERILEEGKSMRDGKVGTRPVEPVVADCGDVKVSLRLQSTLFDYKHRVIDNSRNLESREWATLTISPPCQFRVRHLTKSRRICRISLRYPPMRHVGLSKGPSSLRHLILTRDLIDTRMRSKSWGGKFIARKRG
ncbi:hypothetical protein ACFY5C_07545 [Streptomyces sp. NPDC012935]|uniref:ApeA N-terminal domain 1-containing protein n=1 Tax=Streptomyces sp. NPDC012935 TaxID=3364857 RepID=UPI003697166E